MKKTAIIVIDMLDDFVNGSLKCDRAQNIIPSLAKLIAHARENDMPVLFSNDAHYPGIDKELDDWGPHAIAGTPGAEVIEELAPTAQDFIVPKHRYSGFFGTEMQLILSKLEVKQVVICGMHAHICVRHTAADAYQWGYNIIIPTDGVEAFTEEDYQYGLSYLENVYFAKITTVDEFIAES